MIRRSPPLPASLAFTRNQEDVIMKARRTASLALLGLALAWTVLAQTASPMREGNWEVSVKMEMPGMPMEMPPMKMTQCVTREQLKDPQSALPKGFEDGDSDCKISDYKLSGSSASWRMTCTKPHAMTGTGEIAYAGDSSYKGKIAMDMNGAKMNMAFDAKRLGDCVK
jgi:hypothetical protein